MKIGRVHNEGPVKVFEKTSKSAVPREQHVGRMSRVVKSNGPPSVVRRATATATAGAMSEMHILRPAQDLLNPRL